jgi:hypothetical protein
MTKYVDAGVEADLHLDVDDINCLLNDEDNAINTSGETLFS